MLYLEHDYTRTFQKIKNTFFNEEQFQFLKCNMLTFLPVRMLENQHFHIWNYKPLRLIQLLLIISTPLPQCIKNFTAMTSLMVISGWHYRDLLWFFFSNRAFYKLLIFSSPTFFTPWTQRGNILVWLITWKGISVLHLKLQAVNKNIFPVSKCCVIKTTSQ